MMTTDIGDTPKIKMNVVTEMTIEEKKGSVDLMKGHIGRGKMKVTIKVMKIRK
jgi:hypothetical protein